MAIDSDLWQAYCDPYFRFERQLMCSQFAIITAWNPKSIWLSKSDNDRNNQHLAQEVSHTCWCGVQVGNKDFTWFEESFAVQISQHEALELGRKYQQNAIYYVEGERLFLLSCLEEQSKVALGNWRSRCR
ncbi:DUF3293 domain-containing protein [Vibrio tubiashii]|uniref:DUF3293 domain-containing protein n=1 Tax=Vibrio tubiashii ATCC 19109 TaxID=1051646 RepID=F9T5E7_9VIBR|nr:DUF3293 domain-containing protein [Vibrio tubiashii]AIW15027.1 hypothetical protein IX91_12710 [Vibrio tubiashii ATCC 19109]EGU55108.1 hypothetical protein VITU9109_03495 [Vibrio tubiashii ATCC 19109]EIF01460.1 hypothetical protein VT1337_23476 [Vibrio tubiashii NCIMB 1337 = ATCC 19106]